jgi:hypothetical protein
MYIRELITNIDKEISSKPTQMPMVDCQKTRKDEKLQGTEFARDTDLKTISSLTSKTNLSRHGCNFLFVIIFVWLLRVRFGSNIAMTNRCV